MIKEDIFEYIDRFEKSGLSVFELSEEGTKLRLEKPKPAPIIAASPKELQIAAPAQPQAPAAPSASAEAPAAEDSPSIDSPIVGVFYKAPAPDAEPFAEIGQKIEQGSVMCIVEAMKMMNEIKAPYDLIVKRVLVSDGEMVDCGRKLFEVEKC